MRRIAILCRAIQKLLLILVLILECNVFVYAHNTSKSDSLIRQTIKMTSFGFGGTGVLFTNVNNKFTIMNGGRGAVTFNNRYTLGGAGWGMPKGVEMLTSRRDTFEYFKFGYGGPEIGYIFYPGEKLKFGTNLLIAYGGGFKESIPKTKNSDFKMFPLLEPSIYTQILLGGMFRIDIGLTYRYIGYSKFSHITKQNMSGFSTYIALLVGTCKCE